MAREMSFGELNLKEVNFILEQTKFRPVETTREVVTETESWSESEGSAASSGSSQAHPPPPRHVLA